jgi:CheY-like chemotaxis protein
VPNILVVDDDPALRRILQMTLELEGYQITLAENGEEALRALARTPLPDVVILDVMMPKVDGLQVLQQARQHPRTADIPVILLTARRDADDLWEGWRRGVDYYITKPFDVEDLLRVLDKVLPGRAPAF